MFYINAVAECYGCHEKRDVSVRVHNSWAGDVRGHLKLPDGWTGDSFTCFCDKDECHQKWKIWYGELITTYKL